MTIQKQWGELNKFSEELHSKSPYGIRLVTTHGVFLTSFNGVYGWEDDFLNRFNPPNLIHRQIIRLITEWI